ncbi:hypothetical protein FSP39_009891 [Pinctada imbricata]|uniref:Uncharacterized protein n=1 Tax=Pinctada imbricata TaxID=66713 RepID=A0AA88XR98_PINIB|nr:hypothetical protein FSP39_009891 [Pinctada imbricata]
MDSLKKSEQMLQREISLLDEILSGVNFNKYSDSDKVKEKPPPLPRKSANSPKRPSHINLSPRDDRYITASSQGSISGYSDSILLSPNLVTKLRQIPSNSKLSAPLPYVNLEKYDVGDVDNSHVYVPAPYEGNRSAPCHRSESCDDIGRKNRHVSENSPPPELPPKGPALLKKSAKLRGQGLPPPIPPGRHRLSLNLSHSASRCSHVQSPKSARSYRTNHSSSRYSTQNGGSEYYGKTRLALFPEANENESDVVLRVKLPKQSSGSLRREQFQGSEPCGYMDMSGMFEEEKTTPKEAINSKSQKQYGRSQSASSIVSDTSTHTKPHLNHSHSASATAPVREENYLLMSNFPTPKRLVTEDKPKVQEESVALSSEKSGGSPVPQTPTNASLEEDGGSDIQSNSTEKTLPFPNLMNFHRGLLPQTNSQGKSSPTSKTVSEGTKTSTEQNGKSPGFLTRLIRRNSGNRKSVSQSQENLLASSSSESCLEKTNGNVSKSIVERRKDSSESVGTEDLTLRYQGQQEMSLPANVRRRSSSFPNRSSFIDMLGKVEGSRREQSDTFSSGSQDETKSLLDQESEGSENNVTEASAKGYSGPFVCESEKDNSFTKKSDKEDDDDEDKKESPRSVKKHKLNQSVGIFTVLHVDQPKYDMDCQRMSKTDDEKMIELMNYSSKKDYFSDTDSSKSSSQKSDKQSSSTSLPFKKSMSPSEEAAAIAKHVSSLPPFVPPKQKTYPCSLSPVLESVPSFPKSNKLFLSDTSSIRSSRSNRSLGSVSKADLEAALASISGKSLEESIWIPRSQSDSSLCKSTTMTITSEDQEAKFAALVVEIDQEQGYEDTASLSSQESYNLKDDVVHNSPGTTILRPRSGKNYLFIERKRPLNESSESSPVQSPHSPSVNSSVFTFDDQISCSQYSAYSRDRESPNVPKVLRSDSLYSRFSERISPPKATYMNVDMTPPSSPPYCGGLSVPSETAERQLNYADIDLTLPTRASRKYRKASQKSIKIPKTETIDYALIDMEATVAIQCLGQEHKMSREDSLRRPSHKFSLLPKDMLEEEVEDSDVPSEQAPVPHVKEDTSSTVTSPQSSVPDDFKIPISVTHKYVNVPPPKDQSNDKTAEDSSTSKENLNTPLRDSSLNSEIFESPENILLPIRENPDTSSSDEEILDDDSSDDEVLIVE